MAFQAVDPGSSLIPRATCYCTSKGVCSSQLQTATSPCRHTIDPVLWPIRTPTFRLSQSEPHYAAAPLNTRELSSRLSGHTSASHAYTRTPHATSHLRLYLFQYKFVFCLSFFGIDNESRGFTRTNTRDQSDRHAQPANEDA